MWVLKENESLVFAGYAELRSPSGELLPAVPQYMIVNTSEAAADKAVELQENESLILAGHVHNDRKNAEERFTALKSGQNPPPRSKGVPLYFKEKAENTNQKTKLSIEEQKTCDLLIDDMLEEFSVAMRKKKALKRQGEI